MLKCFQLAVCHESLTGFIALLLWHSMEGKHSNTILLLLLLLLAGLGVVCCYG